MRKLLTAALVSIVTLSSYGMGSRRPKVPNEPPPIETPSSPTAPAVKGIKFSPLKNHTAEEVELVSLAEVLANELVKSQCFSNFMETRAVYSSKGKLLQKGLISTNGKTAKEVVEQLKSTNLAVPVEMYYSNNSTVGYRNVGSPIVHTNRKFHAGSTACARGSNLTHEWSHVVGYGHTSSATLTRPASVPYSINAAFEACCECKKKSVKECSVKP